MIAHRGDFFRGRRPGAADIHANQRRVASDGKDDLGQLLADADDPHPLLVIFLVAKPAAAARKDGKCQNRYVDVYIRMPVTFILKDISQLRPSIVCRIVWHRQEMRIGRPRQVAAKEQEAVIRRIGQVIAARVHVQRKMVA